MHLQFLISDFAGLDWQGYRWCFPNWHCVYSQRERNLYAISVKDNHAPVYKLLIRNVLIRKLARKAKRHVKSSSSIVGTVSLTKFLKYIRAVNSILSIPTRLATPWKALMSLTGDR